MWSARGRAVRWVLSAATLVVAACASDGPVVPLRSATCDFGGDPPIVTGAGCARVYGQVTFTSGLHVPYGSMVATANADTLSPANAFLGEGRVNSVGAFDIQFYFPGGVNVPGDTIRTMIYARSPWWNYVPYDSVPVTLHVVHVGERLRVDTVRLVSSATPTPY